MIRNIPKKFVRPFQFLFCIMAFLGLVAANHNNQSINLYGGGSYVLGDDVSLGYNLPPNHKAVLRLYNIKNPEALLENGGPRNFSASDELDLELIRDKKISESSEYQYDDVIFENLKVGMYFAQLESGNDASATLIAVSDVSLVVKSDQDSILAYTANLTTGTPLKTKVFLMRDGKIYAEGLATDDGLTNFNIEDRSNNNQTFVAAKFGSSWAFSESYWSSWGIEKTKIYVHTDRSVYRPEHIVYFKGTARQPNGLTPIAGEAVEVRVNDSEGTEIFRASYESDDFGSFHGELKLGVEPPLGSYSIITTVAGEESYNNFYVEEFQKPEYKVEVTSDDSVSVQGGKATFLV